MFRKVTNKVFFTSFSSVGGEMKAKSNSLNSCWMSHLLWLCLLNFAACQIQWREPLYTEHLHNILLSKTYWNFAIVSTLTKVISYRATFKKLACLIAGLYYPNIWCYTATSISRKVPNSCSLLLNKILWAIALMHCANYNWCGR